MLHKISHVKNWYNFTVENLLLQIYFVISEDILFHLGHLQQCN